MGAGSMGGANVSLRNNRKLVKKRALRNKGEVYGKEGVTKIEFKKSSAQDMRRIRQKIQGYKQERQITLLIALAVSFFILYSLWWWATS